MPPPGRHNLLRQPNPWCEPSNGLSGRVRVEFEDLKPGLRYAVYLELWNITADPIAMTNHPQVHALLLDSAGGQVSRSGVAIDGPVPTPEWVVIPSDIYIGFRIDMRTVGVPISEQRIALIAVGGQSWRIGTGRYLLKVSMVCPKANEGPTSQWIGELILPPVDIVLTADMLVPS